MSTYNDDEGDKHPTLSHADPLLVTKETEKTTTCDETLIDQTASCDVDPLSITTCCKETVGQSSSHVNPVIIDEQKTATIACGNERNTVDIASIIPACSNNISEPFVFCHVFPLALNEGSSFVASNQYLYWISNCHLIDSTLASMRGKCSSPDYYC